MNELLSLSNDTYTLALDRGEDDRLAVSIRADGQGTTILLDKAMEDRLRATLAGDSPLSPQARQVLTHAYDEVVALRRRLAEREPRAEAYDLLHAVITRLQPPPSQGFGEDVAWRIWELLNGHPHANGASDDA